MRWWSVGASGRPFAARSSSATPSSSGTPLFSTMYVRARPSPIWTGVPYWRCVPGRSPARSRAGRSSGAWGSGGASAQPACRAIARARGRLRKSTFRSWCPLRESPRTGRGGANMGATVIRCQPIVRTVAAAPRLTAYTAVRSAPPRTLLWGWRAGRSLEDTWRTHGGRMERVTQREESRPLGPGGSGGGAGPRVVEYDPARREHVEQFRALNLAWITEHFAVEDADRRALDDAEGEILRPGGCILVAEEGDGAVVGACALVRHGGAPIELAKMAVAPAARGRGVGRLLGEAAVARAKALGVPRVELLSNTALAPAIALYRGLGFVEVPLGGVEYRRANIRMVLDLAPLVKCVLVVADDLPPGLAANAAAVLALSLGRRLPDLVGPDVRDGGGTTHAGLTWIPLPVLRAPRGALARL